MKKITNPVKAIRAKCLDCCCDQIAERYLAGSTTKEIAEELGVTTATIHHRRKEIREAFYHDDDKRLRWLSRAGRGRRPNKNQAARLHVRAV